MSDTTETKRFVDVASLPPDYELAPEWDVCVASIMRPAAQERIKKLMGDCMAAILCTASTGTRREGDSFLQRPL
jgi:hypothetical protein